jgi:RNA polymerase sigma factor (TIGR02999 family)
MSDTSIILAAAARGESADAERLLPLDNDQPRHAAARCPIGPPMSPLTQLLEAIDRGDAQATNALFPIVYDELRRIAQGKLTAERPGQTLGATELVHEAYLRLVGNGEAPQGWNSRGHFFAAAAEAMRRILIDQARRRHALTRGGDRGRVELSDLQPAAADQDERLLDLDEALSRLEQDDAEKARLVKLRFFAGLTNEEAAAALGISTATAQRAWAYCRAWLRAEMDA